VEKENNQTVVQTLERRFPNISLDEKGNIASFTNSEEEYAALRHGVGAFLRIPSQIELSGEDARKLLERLVTVKVTDLLPFEKRNAFFLNDYGKIIDFVRIYSFGEKLLIFGNKVYEEKLFKWILKYVTDEKINVKTLDDYVFFEIMGRQAESFVLMFQGNKNAFSFSEENAEGIQYFSASEKTVNGNEHYTFLIRKNDLTKFVDFLNENKSVFDFRFVGSSAFEVYRVEEGFPIAPNEINDSFSPLELGFADSIASDKKSFLGYDALLGRSAFVKKERELYAVLSEKEFPFAIPFSVDGTGKIVGEITSAVISPYFEKTVGMGVFEKDELETCRKERSCFFKEFDVEVDKFPLRR